MLLILFQVIGVIAKGAFGDVLKVRKFEDQIDYAMKVGTVEFFAL